MRIKPPKKSYQISDEKLTSKISKQMKYLFSLNNRKTVRGPYRKPFRDTGEFSGDKLQVQSTIYVHNKPEKVIKNVCYISRDAIEAYKRENEQSIINKHDVSSWENDKYHYMLIISQPRENELRLDEFTKELVKEIQNDLGTRFDWIAAVHRNTDNPHVHLMIRGKDETNKDLEIRTQYFHRVVPQIASEIATVRLRQDKNYLERNRRLTNDLKHTNKQSQHRAIRRRF